jgi:arginyl-tRNA synthetase
MSPIKVLENDLKIIISDAGYELDSLTLNKSSRPDLGTYQINDAMRLAKTYHESPTVIAAKITKELSKDERFTNINIAMPGFINITLSTDYLIKTLNTINTDLSANIDKLESKKVLIDYGGANIAKALHVGHLRSANIGEALKRLARLLGYDMIGDVHYGDIGRQSGMVISEIKRRYPNLAYFNPDFTGDYNKIDFTITEAELGEIYPTASLAAANDPERLKEVVTITADLEAGNKAYLALWNKCKEVSIKDINKIYQKLNTTFELTEGELDCYPYIPEMLEYLRKNNYLESSEGAEVIDVKESSDTAPMPPLVVVKSNGATLYATRELATLYSRVKRFALNEIWYLTDLRQSLYFEQVFRAAKKSAIVPENINLAFYGFGTMNGADGKPFKTRDGGVMSLKELIKLTTDAILARMNKDTVAPDKREETAEMIAIAAIKYADFLPFRATDYNFDLEKFIDLEGKTGPYILYSTIRMKSLLNKASTEDITTITKLTTPEEETIANLILELPRVLNNSFKLKSLNDIADYLYNLTSAYNTFYANNRVLTESDQETKESWLTLTSLVYKVNTLLLDVLAIKVPEKM